MIFLSKAALRYAVDICSERDGYKVGIAVDASKRSEVKEYLSSLVAELDSVDGIRNSFSEYVILFKNGSRIRIILASENSRGTALHLLIVDKELPESIVKCIFIPLEKMEWIEWRDRHRADKVEG